MRARPLPPAVAAARDALFVDADHHGPRWPVLARRLAPALLLLPASLLLAAWHPWRSFVSSLLQPVHADVVLVAPVLAAVVLLAAMAAPLARVRMTPLVGAGLLLVALGLRLVADGMLVAAVVPSAVGSILLGAAAARVVRRAIWALPVLLAAGVSDAQSVEGGLTARLVGTTSRGTDPAAATLSVAPAEVTRIDLLVLHLPASSGTWMLGLVDVVAVGLLLGLAHLWWLPVRRAAPALAAVLVVTLAATGPVPVLPLLGLAWLLVNARFVWRATRFSLRRLTYLGG